jgi:hypothetical protein
MMLQPGLNDETNLLLWLHHSFERLREMVQNDSTSLVTSVNDAAATPLVPDCSTTTVGPQLSRGLVSPLVSSPLANGGDIENNVHSLDNDTNVVALPVDEQLDNAASPTSTDNLSSNKADHLSEQNAKLVVTLPPLSKANYDISSFFQQFEDMISSIEKLTSTPPCVTGSTQHQSTQTTANYKDPILHSKELEIERLNEELSNKKSHTKVLEQNRKALEEQVKELIKENGDLEKVIEKQKNEVRKANNARDNAISEKVSAKRALSQIQDQNNLSTTTKPKACVNDSISDKPKGISEVVIIADEMAKGISQRLPHDSIAFCMSGAKATNIKQNLSQIRESRAYTVLQCGTNNLKEELRISIPALGSLLDEARRSTNSQILVNAIPHHLRNKKHNDLAWRLNTFLRHKCSRSDRLHYINCNPNMEAKYYATDGLHFSDLGKQKYADSLASSLARIENFGHLPQTALR